MRPFKWLTDSTDLRSVSKVSFNRKGDFLREKIGSFWCFSLLPSTYNICFSSSLDL